MGLPIRDVVVIEDDEDTRLAFQDALGLEGYRVRAFGDARAALAALQQDPAAGAILLDWRMPAMNGAQFLAAKLAEPKLAPIPVIVISCLEFRGPPPGARAVLPKPFPLARLLELLAPPPALAPTPANGFGLLPTAE